jgi:DNA-binding NarL/FixJ family response regulator
MVEQGMVEQGTRLRLVLVDDHPLFRAGIACALTRELGAIVVGEAGTAGEALAMIDAAQPDVAIVDVLLPAVSGISLVSELAPKYPRLRVLALSVIDEPGLIADMLRAGASGFALKTQPPDEIADAVRLVLGGLRYLPPNISRAAIDAELASPTVADVGRLTPREREIFELLIRGHSNDEIASRLYISRRTVETHRQHIVKKLSARSLAEMMRIAAKHGGLEVPSRPVEWRST